MDILNASPLENALLYFGSFSSYSISVEMKNFILIYSFLQFMWIIITHSFSSRNQIWLKNKLPYPFLQVTDLQSEQIYPVNDSYSLSFTLVMHLETLDVTKINFKIQDCFSLWLNIQLSLKYSRSSFVYLLSVIYFWWTDFSNWKPNFLFHFYLTSFPT